MRLSADTNVVVRYLTEDDPAQTEQAAEVLDAAEVVYVSIVVLCETVWVLSRSYGLSAGEIAEALTEFIDSANVEVDRRAAEAGLAMLRSGGDFADGIILHQSAQALCGVLVTFDRRFARVGGERVMLLTTT